MTTRLPPRTTPPRRAPAAKQRPRSGSERPPEPPRRLESIPASIVEEAIAWAVRIEFNAPDHDTREAFDRWLNAAPLHACAWRRVQSLRDDFDAVAATRGVQG